TNGSGQASVGYIAPQLDFVPVGASVIAAATLSIPGNPQGSPRGTVTFLLRPKGSQTTSGTGGGSPVAPTITAVTPSTIKVDNTPPTDVIVQGTNFDKTSQVLIVTLAGVAVADTTFLST